MKPYTKLVLKEKQHNFNYRLSRARMVVECSYGQLKGRLRLIMRKSEGGLFQTKVTTLPCMVLHNVCLMNGDVIPSKYDLSINHETNKKRDRSEIREISLMNTSRNVVDHHKITTGTKIRDTIVNKL